MATFFKKFRRYILACGCASLLVSIFWVMSFDAPPIEKKETPKKVDTLPDIVDPRETWTYKLEKAQQAGVEKVEVTQAENKRIKEQLTVLIDRVEQMAQEREMPEKPISETARESGYGGDAIKQEVLPMAHISLSEEDLVGQVAEEEEDIKNVESYIPAGTFVKSVLLTGVVAGTGVSGDADPQPLLIRLTDNGVIPRGFSADLKDAVLIGSCQGDISSERANCRIQTLTLIEKNGEAIEMDVEGWVIGEDGRPGIKGLVVDRSSEVVRLAMINGILGGMASFFQQQASTGMYPVSPISGQANALKGSELLQAGGYQGVNNALEKMADFAIKKAEQMQPVIVVNSGRQVEVVFKKGIDLKDASYVKKETRINTSPLIKQHASSIAKSKTKSWQKSVKAHMNTGVPHTGVSQNVSQPGVM